MKREELVKCKLTIKAASLDPHPAVKESASQLFSVELLSVWNLCN